MMKNKNLELARILVDSINSHPFLYSRLSSDFSDTPTIEIRPLVRLTVSAFEFVFCRLSALEVFHLEFLSSDDSSNLSYWKVV